MVATLAALAVLLAALSSYLWLSHQSELESSTAAINLPDEVGDFTIEVDDESGIDLEQTRKDYSEMLNASFDVVTYTNESAESDDDVPTMYVEAVNSDFRLTPGYTTEDQSVEIVRDDLVCRVEGEDGVEGVPVRCKRTGDGLTVYVTPSGWPEGHPQSLDEVVAFTDALHDAAK